MPIARKDNRPRTKKNRSILISIQGADCYAPFVVFGRCGLNVTYPPPNLLTLNTCLMSESMFKARSSLMNYYGEGYGRIRFVWLCQAYQVSQSDECPLPMVADVEEETAPRKSRRGLA